MAKHYTFQYPKYVLAQNFKQISKYTEFYGNSNTVYCILAKYC